MTLKCKFFMNQEKRYTQSVQSVQYSSCIVILRVASNFVNSSHKLLLKKRFIHGLIHLCTISKWSVGGLYLLEIRLINLNLLVYWQEYHCRFN